MEFTTERSKRYRSSSPSASSSSSGASSAGHTRSPPPKFHRLSPDLTDQYTCYLPPTCNQPSKATVHTSQSELERHQLHFHNHVCRVPIRDHSSHNSGRGRPHTRSDARKAAEADMLPDAFVSGGARGQMRECGRVFPDERFLSLHYTECHDTIAKCRQSDGEKIFECFVPSPECGKKFASPLTRRHHLRTKHQYPADYFFAVTNHGLNQILKEDGLAASMIRPRKDPPASIPPRKIEPIRPQTSAPMPSDQPTVDQASTVTDMEVDDVAALANQLNGSLALAFVPSSVRRKAGGKVVASQVTSDM